MNTDGRVRQSESRAFSRRLGVLADLYFILIAYAMRIACERDGKEVEIMTQSCNCGGRLPIGVKLFS
jgi:hypothetical protein